MNRKLKLILLELIWLIICFCFTILIVLLLWQWDFKYHLITIRILETPVAFSDFGFVFSLWLFVVLLVYSFKEVKLKYKRLLPNIIAILAGLSFIVSLSFLNGGWTSYPPLSNLGGEGLTPEQFDNMILGLRITASFFVSVIIYKWVKIDPTEND